MKFLDSWKQNSIGTRILRLWLGVTWLYAGLQKAFDAGFFNKASSTFIGTQLAGYAHSSPIGWILTRAVEHAVLFGWLVMLGEIAVGLAILTGVAMQAAAIGGLFIALLLWLSASWTVSPYFLGSDTAYAIMWLALLLLLRREMSKEALGPVIPRLTNRRTFVGVAGVGIASVLAAIAGTSIAKPQKQATAVVPSATSSTQAAPAGVKPIVKLADLPVGANLQFTAPDGNPAYLFRTAKGVYAYSAICTHQGCVVGYDNGSKKLICPCHGGAFDPYAGGAVVGGPPPTPLATYKVQIIADGVYNAG